jgi:hypothetical protein
MSVLLSTFHPTHKRNNNINNNITDNITDSIDNISQTTIMVDASTLTSTSASVRPRRAAVGIDHNNNNNGEGEGGLSFPLKLHSMLDDADRKRFTDVVAWQQGDKSFKVNDVNRFGNEVMPQYFNQTKFKSFQRQ